MPSTVERTGRGPTTRGRRGWSGPGGGWPPGGADRGPSGGHDNRSAVAWRRPDGSVTTRRYGNLTSERRRPGWIS
jgi:hypothetical protein